VLAHEFAHRDLGHLDAFDGWGKALRFTRSRLTASMLRLLERRVVSAENETAADRLGFELCLDAGYDAERCLRLFDVLTMEALDWGDLDAAYGNDDDLTLAEGPVASAFFAARTWLRRKRRTHPSLAERKAELKQWLATRRETPTSP